MTHPYPTPVDTLDLPVADDPRTLRQSRRPGPAAVAALLLAAAVAGTATGAVLATRDGAGTTASSSGPTASATDAAIAPASVASFDPSGGTGFLDDEGGWRTQTYTTAEFGNLKDGVGLLLDLGEAREVSSVAFETQTPGVAVELRTADSPTDSVEDYSVVDTVPSADGAVTLDGEDGGAHRYWLVWVTGLAPVDGGFGARISAPVVEGPDAG